MIIDDFYNYIVIGLFEQLYKYEDKKSISVDNLKYIRKIVLEEVLDRYYNEDENKICYYQEVDQWHGKVSFKVIDEDKALQAFLDEYEDYFYLDNGIVYLREKFTYDDIEKLERKVRISEKVPHRIGSVVNESYDNPKIVKVLGVSSIAKIKEDYSQVEKELEKLYYKLYTNDDNEKLRKQIVELLYMRLNFFYLLSQMPEYKIDAFRLIQVNYDGKEEDIEYDKCPIDLKLWEENTDLDEFLADIDDRIYDINQYAIFGKERNHLCYKKLEEDLENFYMSNYFFEKFDEEIDPLEDDIDIDEFEIEDESFEEILENNPENAVTLFDSSEEFYLLYLNYLKNLNNFINIYGESEELLFAKKRLLYVLDKPELMLFNEKRFEMALDKTKTIALDEEEPFSFFLDEIYFIARELFMVPSDEYTIRKLLLVGTYYDLTKDETIRDIIGEFKDNSKYDSFYEIMINNCKNMTTDNLSQDIKKLVLRKDEKNKSNN